MKETYIIIKKMRRKCSFIINEIIRVNYGSEYIWISIIIDGYFSFLFLMFIAGFGSILTLFKIIWFSHPLKYKFKN